MADLMNIGGGLYLPDMAALYREGRQTKADNQALAQNAYNQDRQQTLDKRADDQYANTQAAAQQAAAGDHAGAEKTALAAGNFATLDHLDAIDDKARSQAADDAEFVGRLAPALQTIDGSDNGAARREAARPYLKQRGLTDDQINTHDFSDHGLQVATAASMSIKDRLAQQREDREANKPITAADGAVLVSDGKGSYQTIYTPGTKPLTQVVTDPVTGEVKVVNVPGTAGQSVGRGAPSGGAVGAGGFATIDNGFEKGAEGGYADRDGASGAPVNFGINQKFNPDIDVKHLTPDAAQQIRKQRYWDASGAANQPTPAGQAVVYDTAINMGVPTAQRMIKETGGDPQKMLDWREQRYRSIGANPANAANLPNWLDRNNQLRQYVGQGGRSAAQASPASGPSIVSLGGSSGPVWKPDTQNGMVGQTNTRTGEFKPLAGQKAIDPATVQGSADAITNAETTLRGLYDPATGKEHPGLQAAVGSDFDPYSIVSHNPLTGKAFSGSNRADFETQLGHFNAQAFQQQIQTMRGLGALSDAEGAKVTAAMGNLSTNQSESQFKANVKSVLDVLDQAKARLARMRTGQVSGSQHAPAQSAPQTQTAPQGATRIGTSKKTGRPVYRLANGQTVLG